MFDVDDDVVVVVEAELLLLAGCIPEEVLCPLVVELVCILLGLLPPEDPDIDPELPDRAEVITEDVGTEELMGWWTGLMLGEDLADPEEWRDLGERMAGPRTSLSVPLTISMNCRHLSMKRRLASRSKSPG